MKKAIYPGTFDPITFGHIDLIKKSLNIFDKVIVAVSDGNTKNYLFNAEEREHLIKKALFSDLKFSKKKIVVTSFKTLTTDFCRKMKSNVIIRGLRATSDFEYEFQLAGMNKKLKKLLYSLNLYFKDLITDLVVNFLISPFNSIISLTNLDEII